MRRGGWKISKSNEDGKYDQSTLNACMEMSQGNPFVQFMYADIKENVDTHRIQSFKKLGTLKLSLTFKRHLSVGQKIPL
jgi:hypothetical protein